MNIFNWAIFKFQMLRDGTEGRKYKAWKIISVVSPTEKKRRFCFIEHDL